MKSHASQGAPPFDDIRLSAEEAAQFDKAFSDDTFRNLLTEYVAELSDPKNNEEQTKYIAQLEAQKELPSGKALIWPSRGFVVKIMHRKKRAVVSTDDDKLFLNIVHSERIAKPNASNPDQGGTTWSIPYALGPLRMERDKSGTTLVATFDCCFHPLSLRHAHARKEFLDLAIHIATDAVENSFKMSGDEVIMIKGYTILRGVSYKSGTPKALLVNSSGEMAEEKIIAPSKEVQSVVPAVVDATPVVAANELKPSMVKIRVPKYKIVEQGVFDIADHTNSPLTPSVVVPRRPKHIVVHVFFDESTTTSANINLDVSEKELKIQPDDNCRYDLTVKLPYPVHSEKGNARFDKKHSTLIVKLPVAA